MIEARRVDPEKEDLRFLDGPWRNDACMGYALMAMQRAGFDGDATKRVMSEMIWCFDDTTVEEAARHYLNGSKPKDEKLANFIVKNWHFCPLPDEVSEERCEGWGSKMCAKCILKHADEIGGKKNGTR